MLGSLECRDKDKRAMRQWGERVGTGLVREDFAGLEVWIES